MKGLLIKDFMLMKEQKNFFFMAVAIAVFMGAFYDNIAFMLGFTPFLLSTFSLSTISYDEFDNGNAFLFTLPVSRKGYAASKYCLALLLDGGACIFSTLIAVIFCIPKGNSSVFEIVMTAVIILPVLIMFQAVMIPLQLKFGSEKGRIVQIAALGLLGVIFVMAVKISKALKIDTAGIIDNLSKISMGIMAVCLFAAAAIILLISLKISVSIMKKKEF